MDWQRSQLPPKGCCGCRLPVVFDGFVFRAINKLFQMLICYPLSAFQVIFG